MCWLCEQTDSESWQGVRKVVIAEVEAERQAAEKGMCEQRYVIGMGSI
jgi:hypothetical protein